MMRILRHSLLLVLFSLLPLHAISQQHTNALRDFKVIIIDNNLDLILRQSDEPQIRIIASGASKASDVKYNVHNNVLRIKRQSTSLNGKITIMISYKNLQALTARSSVNVQHEGLLRADSLKIMAEKNSYIVLDLLAPQTEIQAYSGSQIELSGDVNDLTVKSKDSAKIMAFDLLSKSVIATTESSSIVEVYAEHKLLANAKTNSRIFFKGRPSLSMDTSGVGVVRSR